MAQDPANRPLVGRVQGGYRARWITFETDDNGGLLIRTLNGFRRIDDPIRAAEILKTLEAIAEIP